MTKQEIIEWGVVLVTFGIALYLAFPAMERFVNGREEPKKCDLCRFLGEETRVEGYAVGGGSFHKHQPTAIDSNKNFHFAVAHGRGDPTEDPKGCPCLCVCMGYSSYANCTNALQHGFDKTILEYISEEQGRRSYTLAEFMELMKKKENEIMNEIASKEDTKE